MGETPHMHLGVFFVIFIGDYPQAYWAFVDFQPPDAIRYLARHVRRMSVKGEIHMLALNFLQVFHVQNHNQNLLGANVNTILGKCRFWKKIFRWREEIPAFAGME